MRARTFEIARPAAMAKAVIIVLKPSSTERYVLPSRLESIV